jgi:hypothetical protein
MRQVESLNHTRWECKYHIVFIPKYRKKVRSTLPGGIQPGKRIMSGSIFGRGAILPLQWVGMNR